MTEITIVVPYRDSGCEHRNRSMNHVVDVLSGWYPDTELYIVDDSSDVFSRSGSRNCGVSLAETEVVVLCDADTLPQKHALNNAIDGAASDGRLHLPYTLFRGLTERGTDQVIEKGVDPIDADLLETATHSIGGVWVIRKDSWESIGGMDERFRDWGYEDNALFEAANCLLGSTVRHHGSITHLWHPIPADRLVTDTYRENQKLFKRYRRARRKPAEMRSIIEER